MTLTFRTAGRDDVPAIVRLTADDALSTAGDVYSEPLDPVYGEAFDRMAAQPGNSIVLAELDGRIVGCFQFTVVHGLVRRGASRATVEAVKVDGALRGQGIGSAMMRHAIALARAEGCVMVQLTSQTRRTDAHRFYERLGFRASHVGMKLLLTPEA
ncbi:acetyltransferase (GNAT) family protein [Azospirillum brasilense]|uniref:Acetyltransferase (GNAT) family protein n=1 Tax=Azospirillum brasilense TaxID=192 RepID=A0A560CJV5_AZOBR|nr:GNAT family N-acetyltransferase [Azospirillum brasilense]TWA85096.1 acetyltransferase (GNAT) family protein [Azospirillum brasilense]